MKIQFVFCKVRSEILNIRVILRLQGVERLTGKGVEGCDVVCRAIKLRVGRFRKGEASVNIVGLLTR
jgi:hypothetical protein